ncbi:oligosaccharide flippase family protein [Pelagibius sp.]|uniref:oligosaccharide flippase family protein n=1 Tax=Pelagibius sp. TaxID=1931238 RepID=UPI003BB17665
MASIRRSLVLSFAQRYSALAIQFASMVLLARLLSPEEFGTFAVAAALVTLANVLQDFGAGNYLVKETELTRPKIETAFSLALVIAWPLGLLLFLSAPFLAEWYANPAVNEVLRLLSLTFILVPFSTPVLALMRRDMQFGRLYGVGVASAAATASVSISLALHGTGVTSLAWGLLAGSVASTVLAHCLRPGYLFLKPGVSHWAEVLGFGGQSAAIAALSELGNQAPSLVAGRLLGFEATGLLHRATATIHIYRKGVLDGLMPVLLPAFAGKVRSGISLKPLYLRGISYLTVVGWPFSLVLALLAHPLVRVLFGDQWDAAVPVIQVLCLLGVVTPFIHLNRSLFIAVGRIDISLKIQLIVQPLKIVLVVVAATQGLLPLAFALCLPPLLNAIISHGYLTKLLDYGIADLLQAGRQSLAVTLLASAVPLAVIAALGAEPENSLLALALGGLGAFAGWLTGLMVFAHPAKTEIGIAVSRVLPGFVRAS